MLRNRQHSRTDPPLCRHWPGAVDDDPRIEVLADMVDRLDLGAFLLDPAYRCRLNLMLSCFSDAEFDSFELLYTSRLTVN